MDKRGVVRICFASKVDHEAQQVVIAGKTHTMMGYSQAGIAQAGTAEEVKGPKGEKSPAGVAWTNEKEMGISPRLIQNIFSGIANADSSMEFTVQVAYVEIYLEKVRDLLNPAQDNLKLRENKVLLLVLDSVLTSDHLTVHGYQLGPGSVY